MIRLPWFNQNGTSKKGIVGIEVLSGGIAFAHLQGQSSPEVKACELISSADSQQTRFRLKEAVSSLDLKGASCNIVLSADDYSLLLVESPNVPSEELREAVKWKIKDLSPIPLDKAVIDVFEMPEDSGAVGKGMVFAVVAKKQAIEDAVALAESAELSINSIDIPELCLRNIAIHNSQHSRSVVLVRLLKGAAKVTAVCGGNVYLSRSFNLSYQQGPIQADQAEQLTLELQRSVDYFHHQMRQPTPNRIFILGSGLNGSELPESLTKSFSADVSVLDLTKRLPAAAGIDKDDLAACSLAVGAALRDLAVSQWDTA